MHSYSPHINEDSVSDWADGYGIIAPDVVRYIDVVRSMPDAVFLAMQNLAKEEDIPIVDADTAQLLKHLLHNIKDSLVLEFGTGIGYTTLHLAQSVHSSSTIVSCESEPDRQGKAHALLNHAQVDCMVELRLGDAVDILSEIKTTPLIGAAIFSDPTLDRIKLLDELTPKLSSGALIAIPFALCGGRVADPVRAWSDDFVEKQRALNRAVATSAYFEQTQLIPVGDGLLLARKTDR